MADKKISQLTALDNADLAADDVLPIVDTNAVATKKITVANLLAGSPSNPNVQQSDIGTDPNQVPLNQYLGDLAFQSSRSAIIEGGEIDFQGGGSNLLLQSQDFTTTWVIEALTRSANTTTAPDGTATADTVSFTDITTSRIYQTFSGNGAAFTFSVFAKYIDKQWIALRLTDSSNTARFVWFDIQNGVVGTTETGITASIVASTEGFYRCVATISTTTTSNFAIINGVNGDGSTSNVGQTGSAYLWGAQLELASTVGTYVPTTTTAISLDNVAEATQMFIPTSSGVNGEQRIMAFELASDTSLIVKVQGSDGVVRSAALTLS